MADDNVVVLATKKKRRGKPQVQGKKMKSRLVRVAATYADWLREAAKKKGVSVTELTRTLRGGK